MLGATIQNNNPLPVPTNNHLTYFEGKFKVILGFIILERPIFVHSASPSGSAVQLNTTPTKHIM